MNLYHTHFRPETPVILFTVFDYRRCLNTAGMKLLQMLLR